jgi:hypothetical protein
MPGLNAPDRVFWLFLWYPRKKQQLRLGYFPRPPTIPVHSLVALTTGSSSVWDRWRHKQPCCLWPVCDTPDHDLWRGGDREVVALGLVLITRREWRQPVIRGVCNTSLWRTGTGSGYKRASPCTWNSNVVVWLWVGRVLLRAERTKKEDATICIIGK